MLQRLFLGFAPTEIQRQQLGQLQHILASSLNPTAKGVTTANFHLTLAFLGRVTESQRQQLINILDVLDKPRLSVRLHQIALWPKAQVCCLKGTEVGAELALLAEQTQAIVRDLGLHVSEHAFHPHISLFRKAKNLSLAQETCLSSLPNMPFHELVLVPDALHLYHSASTQSGVEYRLLHTWPLGK
ncbi:RNA 2',3'-cyclic phosphodiesterase [Shewanella sp. CG12_big_fil_rev_8_21_14_0_65_47_15]|uniref:RNA 2',3'-cyclic phosphodiesterase n=1 Tax=Shewanella sp. CG12_big_fil_rev_8_21_14_0_65_47_15 TaxID=1975537 RepID=UPI000CB967E1|nr:RNA 2',3'-cyclic phosphodiesterase [Shewanella sp. CG12_big_fil_rev_8_21_14_0_65_47_15]PIW62523.1 MAG: RNA 2',3'-cyclic phosphodiesterase [Shewanella sp. CG12_big_fil_rev_8_21_14_0_65_47_15]